MSIIKSFATVGLAGLFAAPLAAQVADRGPIRTRAPILRNETGVEAARRRAEEARRQAEAARVRVAMDSVTRRSRRGSSRIPPGHLPPEGMCRVWIDGVPPGQQPPVTDCATAERTRTANSRVIYGDRESFPGRGRGKFKKRDGELSRRCGVWDGVVVGGRVIDVCRDSTLQRDRRGRTSRFEIDDDEDSDDKDRSRLSKSEKRALKQARKSGRGRA